MKIFIKFLVLVLILAFVAPFLIKGPDGQALMDLSKLKLSDLKVPSIDNVTSKLPFTEATETDAIRVYKWQDEKGNIHYSDQKNAKKTAELTSLKGITVLSSNQMSSVVKHDIDNDIMSSNKDISLPSPTTIPIANIPKLIEDAKQIEQLLQERKLKQDSILR